MDCGTCGFELEARRTGEIEHHVCPACQALFVPILKSLPLWRAMDDAGIAEPPALEGVPAPERCPTCSRPVEAFGYQFTDVTVFRCTPCRLLIVPAARQIEVRNVWRKANDREERQLVRAAAESEEALAAHVSRKAPRNNSLAARIAAARANAAAHEAEGHRIVAASKREGED